ncbi:pollen-specific leucine-rich repeat extensin-like protein 2 [Lathyrus oleraceus]|uniref:pollen-specific leucine-rich repeat extensin-like protein 2 n=1 Tax=Pisum sativum TaxID=3888 RepID=UPI0021D16CD5|nr:pollen-specific leucine-rich repeat extensin-like protein 2 [Pisum sativum]
MEDVTVDIGKPLNACNLKSMGVIEKVRAKPTLDISWEALKDQRKIPNVLYLFSKIDPPKVVAHYLQDLVSQGVDISEFSVDWLPERPPNFMKRQREPSKKSKKAKKAKLGETFGSRPPVPLTDSPSTEPSDPQSPTLAQLQARVLASQKPPQPEPEATTPPPEQPANPPSEQPQTPPPEQPTTSPSEQQPIPPPEQTTPPPSDIHTIPTSEEIIIPTPQTPADTNQTPPSSPSPNHEAGPAFPTLEEAITLFAESSVEKIKYMSINSGITEAKAKAGAEEAARIATEEAAKASTDALTQGEQSNSGFSPLLDFVAHLYFFCLFAAIPLGLVDPSPAKEPTSSTQEAQSSFPLLQSAPEKSSDDDERPISQVLKKLSSSGQPRSIDPTVSSHSKKSKKHKRSAATGSEPTSQPSSQHKSKSHHGHKRKKHDSPSRSGETKKKKHHKVLTLEAPVVDANTIMVDTSILSKALLKS